MCGIAGLIHRGATSNISTEMASMLQSLRHRGPDGGAIVSAEGFDASGFSS